MIGNKGKYCEAIPENPERRSVGSPSAGPYIHSTNLYCKTPSYIRDIWRIYGEENAQLLWQLGKQ